MYIDIIIHNLNSQFFLVITILSCDFYWILITFSIFTVSILQ